MKVTTSINEIYSKTEVEINYKNTKETSIELIVEIPLISIYNEEIKKFSTTFEKLQKMGFYKKLS